MLRPLTISASPMEVKLQEKVLDRTIRSTRQVLLFRIDSFAISQFKLQSVTIVGELSFNQRAGFAQTWEIILSYNSSFRPDNVDR